MIEGTPLEKIEHNDHYRRFLLFKMFLQKGRTAQIGEKDAERRYNQVEKDLQTLQQVISQKNLNSHAKISETMLRIDKLCQQLGEIIPKVQSKKDDFQGDLLKRWKNILLLKKKNEDESEKKKKQKSSSNKNLMFLTSQLLKKQRISTHNLITHQVKIEEIQADIENMILQAKRQFHQKHNKIQELLKDEKKRINITLEEYICILQRQRKGYLAQLTVKNDRICEKLDQDNKNFTENIEGLKQILHKVRQVL